VPSALDWDDLDEPLIAAFLEHLETDRHNSARTRNLRLTAIRSLCSYAALRHPEHAAVIARVLSIPAKRFDRRIVTFLTAEESVALIDAAPENRWEGRRDRAMLTLALHAGLRVSELISVNRGDIELGPERTSASKAKAASKERSRSPTTPKRFSPPGSTNEPGCQTIRCSRPAPGGA
jgi:site-specific recombinase XerD